MEKDLKDVLLEGSRVLGVGLPGTSLEAFTLFGGELMRWNRKMNLSSIRDPFEIVVKHFLDSLAIAPYLTPGSSLLDIGSGAGFPCIVLKIFDPSLKVASIDSSRKRISFQRHIIRQLGLKRIDAVHAHLPDPAITEKFGKSFDYAVSRAFGSVGALLRIARPLVKDTGTIIAMKGRVDLKEALHEGTTREMKALNVRLKGTVRFTLPFINASRSLLFFVARES